MRDILTGELGLAVRQACKEEASSRYPYRDEQFECIAQLRDFYLRRGWPVLSVDTKKKELLGDFYRSGTAYTDGVLEVLDHDFASCGTGRLVPYGVYDLGRNEGFMMLALGSDTSQLACDSIWRWWKRLGQQPYRYAPAILLLCDCGGGNGNRHYRFKEDLKNLAIDLGRGIQVAHYPPSCSKYNPIEHRMFCHVSRTLQGVILRTMGVAKQFIQRTVTGTGLHVVVEKARKIYIKGQKASQYFLDRMPVVFNDFLPDLNYTLTPYRY